MNTKSFYRFAAIVLALVVIGLLLARSLTSRMEGVGPTGSMPMSEDASDDMQVMDMEGMDHRMNMNNQERTPTNP
jgi:hypothetical protein